MQNKWYDNWLNFLTDIRRRLITPWKHPIFVFYFFGFILVLGGMGIWLPPFLEYIKGVKGSGASTNWYDYDPKSLGTYILALIGTSIAAVLLDLDENPRETNALRAFVLLLAIIGGVAGIFCLTTQNMPLAYIGFWSAMIVWWLLNAKNPKLLHEPTPVSAATGGDDVMSSITGDPGDIKT